MARKSLVSAGLVALLSMSVSGCATLIPGRAAPGTSISAESPAEQPSIQVDAGGVIVVSVGAPPVIIEVYVDPLCPFCIDFDEQYGQDIAEAINAGKLEVHYRLVNFLDDKSASKDYSTRAYAALLSVASAQTQPEVFQTLFGDLFSREYQPVEDADVDLTDEQLRDLAAEAGASEQVQQDIVDGAEFNFALSGALASQVALDSIAGRIAVPAVAHDGKQIDTDDADWLANLIG